MPVRKPNHEECKFKLPELNIRVQKNDTKARELLLDASKENDVSPFCEERSQNLLPSVNRELVLSTPEYNAIKLKELDAAIEKVKESNSDDEILEAYMKKAEFLIGIGNKDDGMATLRDARNRSVPVGLQMKIMFCEIRLGFSDMNHQLISRSIEETNSIIEMSGDMEFRNLLNVYKGLHCMVLRNFKAASSYFLDALPTFTSCELMSYEDIVRYTVYMSMFTLPRYQLGDKIVKCSAIQEALYHLRDIKEFLDSLYNCQYRQYFQNLAKVQLVMKEDRFLGAHHAYYAQEMRLLAYTQMLESYKSITLTHMAETFGVTEDYLERELSRFIATRRLNCMIDGVNRKIEAKRPDSKNSQYQSAVKQGDALLNRIQRLSRVTNI